MSAGVIDLLALLAAATGPVEMAVPARLISGTITTLDYPPGALRRGAEGQTKVGLTITAEGRAINCSLVQSSGDAELDARVCPLATMRMRFSPALDRDGKPIPMNAVLPVRWILESSIPPENPEE